MKNLTSQINEHSNQTNHKLHQKKKTIQVGIFNPSPTIVTSLYSGQVGFIVTGMRDRKEAKIGDTYHLVGQPVEALEGFKDSKPMVFAGVFAFDTEQTDLLTSAIEKLTLNDSAVTFQRVERFVALSLL